MTKKKRDLEERKFGICLYKNNDLEDDSNRTFLFEIDPASKRIVSVQATDPKVASLPEIKFLSNMFVKFLNKSEDSEQKSAGLKQGPPSKKTAAEKRMKDFYDEIKAIGKPGTGRTWEVSRAAYEEALRKVHDQKFLPSAPTELKYRRYVERRLEREIMKKKIG